MVHISETTVFYEHTDGAYIRDHCSLGAHRWYIYQRPLFSMITQMVHVSETTVLGVQQSCCNTSCIGDHCSERGHSRVAAKHVLGISAL